MLYPFGHFIFWIYYRLFYRVKIIGAENIPRTGPVVLCSNHTSNNDPLVLGAFIKRRIHFLAKQELFANWLSSFILKSINAVPTKRGAADMASYRAALAVLDAGGVLGIFAQGHRMKELDAGDAKAGVALYAIKGGAEAVPVKIISDYRAFSRVTVTIGPPVDLSEYRGKKVRTDTLREAADVIFRSVMAL